MHAIVNGRIVLTDKILDGCALLFDKNIIGIVSRETLDAAWADGQSWKGKPLDITDAGGNYVAPGFINLHIHGCGGADTMDATEDSLAVMSRFLVQTGVTSFLPTTMTCDMQTICKALERVRKNMTPIIRRRDEKHEPVPSDNKTEKVQQYRLPGAKVLGAYLEGPFISSKYKGAQNEDSIMPADFMQIKDYADVIKVVVLAPETLGNPEQGLRVIHVAGTNGKGSVTRMLSGFLQKSGRQVGSGGGACAAGRKSGVPRRACGISCDERQIKTGLDERRYGQSFGADRRSGTAP